MTAIGPCNQVSTGAAVTINEVTTVAGAYALSQFMTSGGQVGATASNVTGIANAFATAASLASPALGTSPGATFPANGVSPAPRIDSLANALNACTTTAANCATLFSATPTASGALPTNTLDAAFNLTRAPGKNVAKLYTQSGLSSTFSPALTAAPTDWTLFVTFSGGGMNSPSGLGIDSAGNVRVANYFGVASAFSPLGAPLGAYSSGITGDGLLNSYGLAVDASDNAWIPNEQSHGINGGFGTVTVLSTSGTAVSGSTGYGAGGLNFPIAIAIDPNTTAWVVDYGNSHVTLLAADGTALSGTSGYTTPLFAFPVAVALDSRHFGYIANESSSAITKVAPDGSAFTNYNCCNGASALAVDQQNNVWVANFYGASVSQINSCGTVISPTTFNSAGALIATGYTANSTIDHPQSIAIDGAGNIWIANFRQPYITELAGTTATTPGAQLSPSPGYGPDAQLLEAYAMAIDPGGDLWISNFGSNTVTEFIGMAVPVRTPLLGTPRIP
jgi:hypothetical protein